MQCRRVQGSAGQGVHMPKPPRHPLSDGSVTKADTLCVRTRHPPPCVQRMPCPANTCVRTVLFWYPNYLGAGFQNTSFRPEDWGNERLL